ncbi:MAG: tetratricopeptide repeat protein [Armatimonadota bacterium]
MRTSTFFVLATLGIRFIGATALASSDDRFKSVPKPIMVVNCVPQKKINKPANSVKFIQNTKIKKPEPFTTLFGARPSQLGSQFTFGNLAKKPFGQVITRSPLPEDMRRRMNNSFVVTREMTESAQQLYRKGDFVAAEVECRRALATSPKFNGKPMNTAALQLLGNIYLQQRRNQEALECFTPNQKITQSTSLNLDTALAYVRLGDYAMSKRHYSDRAALQYMSRTSVEDLPGTGDRKSLEASILFARGVDAAMESRDEDAIRNYVAAHNLAPKNALISYQHGISLVYLKRHSEALIHFARAATFGKGRIAKDAQWRMSAFSDARKEKALREAQHIDSTYR